MTSKYAWLARFKEAGQPGLDAVIASSERSRDFSPLSETLLARRKALKLQFEEFTESVLGIPADTIWRVRDIGVHIEKFLSTRVRFSEASASRKQKGHKLVTWATLRQWKDVLVWTVWRHHPEGAQLLAGGLFARLHQHICSLQREYNLQRHLPVKDCFDRNAMRLITERLYATCTNPLWANQSDLAWKICFLTGCRPGSIGASYRGHERDGLYMKVGDIARIQRMGRMEWQIELHIVVLKGHAFGPGERIIVTLRPVKSPMNVVFDVGLLLVMNLFMRKMLPHSTWQAVCDDEAEELTILPKFNGHPLICKGSQTGGILEGQPIRAAALQEHFARIGSQCGFRDAQLYNLRRGWAEDMVLEFGAETTRAGMGHGCDAPLFGNYVPRMATVDVVGLRCGEDIQPGRELTAFKQPSLNPNVRMMSRAELDHLAPGGREVAGPSGANLQALARLTGPSDAGTEGPLVFVPPTFTEKEITDSDEYKTYWEDPARKARTEKLENWKRQLIDDIGPIHTNGRTASVKERIALHADEERLTELWDAYTLEQRRLCAMAVKKKGHVKGIWVKAARSKWDAEHGLAKHTTAQRKAKQAALAEPSPLLQVALTHAPTDDVQGQERNMPDDIAEAERMELDESVARPGELEEPDIFDVSLVPLDVMRASYAQMVMNIHPPERMKRCPDCQKDPTSEATFKDRSFDPSHLDRHRNEYHTFERQIWRFFKHGESWRAAPNRWKANGCMLCRVDGKAYKRYSKSAIKRHWNGHAHYDDARFAGFRERRKQKRERSIVVQAEVDAFEEAVLRSLSEWAVIEDTAQMDVFEDALMESFSQCTVTEEGIQAEAALDALDAAFLEQLEELEA